MSRITLALLCPRDKEFCGSNKKGEKRETKKEISTVQPVDVITRFDNKEAILILKR
jgi:hypothetical protein